MGRRTCVQSSNAIKNFPFIPPARCANASLARWFDLDSADWFDLFFDTGEPMAYLLYRLAADAEAGEILPSA